MKNFEKGKVKVVWLGDNSRKIYSKMFKEKEEAIKFGEEKEHFLVFSLVSQKNMEEFEWDILPYGRYKLYLKTVDIFHQDRGGIARFIEGVL